jgi:hypothetical protein
MRGSLLQCSYVFFASETSQTALAAGRAPKEDLRLIRLAHHADGRVKLEPIYGHEPPRVEAFRAMGERVTNSYQATGFCSGLAKTRRRSVDFLDTPFPDQPPASRKVAPPRPLALSGAAASFISLAGDKTALT